MISKTPLQRWLLLLLVASVIFGAVVGIAIVLLDTWGWLELRIAGTTAILAVGSLAALACDYSRQSGSRNVLPRAGLLMTLIGTGMSLAGIWCDIDAEAYWKSFVVIAIVGLATVIVALLWAARLARRYSWLHHISFTVYYLLAIYASYAIVAENDDDGTMRAIGALSIIAAAIALIVPLLHRLSRMDFVQHESRDAAGMSSVATIDDEIRRLQSRLAELMEQRARLTSER
jgi:hypothetical protein